MADRDDGYTPRVLVIDDEQRIREACRLVLEEEGFRVALSPDGDHGLRRIRKDHFDVILLDLMLPALSGFEVLSRVRALHPDTAVIVITGYATLEHSIEAMKKGAFDFIPKPFTPDQLRVLVAKAVRYNRALQDIADARSRLRVIVDRLSDGVLTTDADRRAVLANPAFLKMVGYGGDGVIGQTIDTFISDEPLCRMIHQALSTGADDTEMQPRELSCAPEKDRTFSVRCTPFQDRRGANLGTLTVLHDITVHKQMDRMKSDFVSLVSHEIRSPLNSILMQINVLLEGLAGDTTPKQQAILGRAAGKIENLISMTSELLDLERIESGSVPLEKQPLDVAELLQEQWAFHQPAARMCRIDMAFEAPEDLPPLIADRRNMEEVLSNLIDNAIKYSPQGGRITLSADCEKDEIVLRVRDTGLGIPPEDLNRLFTRFYRVKTEQTRYIHGTGLGLAIVKHIVEVHRGRIRVESRPGQGSCFSVYLPHGAAPGLGADSP